MLQIVSMRVDIIVDKPSTCAKRKLTSASFTGYCCDTLSMWMHERLEGIAASNALDNTMRSVVAAASVGMMFMLMFLG